MNALTRLSDNLAMKSHSRGLVIFLSTESKEFEEYITSDALPKEFYRIANEFENST